MVMKFNLIEKFIESKKYDYNYLSDYFEMNYDKEINTFYDMSADDWVKKGQDKYLSLFHQMAEQVPAYKDFLKKNTINHELIKIWDDLNNVPTIDKENYLRAYNLNDLCWPNTFHRQHMISVSSGSSGDPFFWPRSSWQEFEATVNHELLVRNFFDCHKKNTLFIVSFAMGMYVAGVLTQNSLQHIAEKGLPITIVSPGINVQENIRIIKELGGYYDQIILAGYPPLIKDILDFGSKQGIVWEKIPINFIFAGEGFSEKWRKIILDKVGNTEMVKSSFSIYGSADANMLAFETPVAIAIRQLISNEPEIYSKFYDSQQRVPGIFQFNPLGRYFEELGKELILSADNGIPLLRYNIHDIGKIMDFADMKKQFISQNNYFNESLSWPFLLLYGKDKTVSFYGLLIYPENVRAALEKESLSKYVSGRLVFHKTSDVDGNHLLQAEVELLPDIEPSKELVNLIKKELVNTMMQTNMEYNKLFSTLGDRALPEVNLYKYGSSDYFLRNNKQNWLSV
jgi:phenylacetate-CoA ligase